MKVIGKQTTNVEVELDKNTLQLVTIKQLLEMIGRSPRYTGAGLTPDCFIDKEGNLSYISYSRGDYEEYTIIRKATETDIIILKTVQLYLNYKNENTIFK